MALPLIPIAAGLAGLGLGAGAASLANKNQPGKGNFLTGAPGGFQQQPRFNPQQQNALSQILNMSLSKLQQPSGFNFAPIEQQARQGFAQQTIPSIAERFTSMGSGSALSSPAFASQLGQAGAGLETNLAALKSQYGLKQQGLEQNLLQQLLQMGLMPQNESFYFQGQPGFLQQAGSGLAAALPQLLALGLL